MRRSIRCGSPEGTKRDGTRDGEGDRTAGREMGARVVVERGLDSGGSFVRSFGRDRSGGWVGEGSGERRQASENRATGDIEIGLGRVPLVM